MDYFNTYTNIGTFIIVSLWALPWKGVALWKAARKGEKIWFVALLILNTLAIVEILYIFVFSKGKLAIFKKKESKEE